LGLRLFVLFKNILYNNGKSIRNILECIPVYILKIMDREVSSMSEKMDGNEKKGLLKSAFTKYILALLIVGLLLFISAGSIKYWNAWLYLLSLAVPMFSVGLYLYVKDPGLLKKRLKTNEREKKQKIYVFFAIIIIFAAYGLPGLDYRFGWSAVPVGLVFTAVAITLIGYFLFVLVLLQNSYASRIVEVQEKQKVIETGVYSVIRHPMYSASILLFLSAPIVLGSYYSIVPMLIYPLILVFRIKNEEAVLMKGLDGYTKYMTKVKYRLIPFVW